MDGTYVYQHTDWQNVFSKKKKKKVSNLTNVYAC